MAQVALPIIRVERLEALASQGCVQKSERPRSLWPLVNQHVYAARRIISQLYVAFEWVGQIQALILRGNSDTDHLNVWLYSLNTGIKPRP